MMITKCRLPLTALLAFFCAAPLVAQQSNVTVRGIVVDEASGEPIVGAYVGVRGTSMGVATTVRGTFVLSDVPRGAIIEVSQLGYAHWIEQVDSSANLRVPLSVNPIIMDALEVVTDRLSRRWRASAVSARRYTTDQILAAPVANARDFAYLRASFGPCPDGRADCIYRRGGWQAPSICIDDIPYGSDMQALAGVPPHEIHLFEIIGGRSIYVYTKQFAERLAMGQVGLMPRMLIASGSC